MLENLLLKMSVFKKLNFDTKENYRFAIFTSERQAATNHIEIWIKYFIQSNLKFVLICNNRKAFTDIKSKYLNLPLLYIHHKTTSNASIVKLLSKIKYYFYLSNTGYSIDIVDNSHVHSKHIFIGHGDSDKTTSAHKFFRLYDEIWVAGDAHKDRLKNIGIDIKNIKIRNIGRPNMKNIVSNSQNEWQKRFDNQINILYLPTWEGANNNQKYLSLDIAHEVIDNIKSNFDISITLKMHPYIGSRQQKYKNILDNKQDSYTIIKKTKQLKDIIGNFNMFICDISATVSEVLTTNCPIFVYIPKDTNIKISHSNMDYSDYTYTFSDTDELIQKMHEVINNQNDYLSKNRTKAMEYIAGSSYTKNDQFIKELHKLEQESYE